jgi:hypothetical protein
MEWQSESLDFEADDEASSRLFRAARGSAAGRSGCPGSIRSSLSSSRSTGIQETTSRSRLTTAATQGSLQSSPVTSGLSRLPVSGGRSPPLSRRLPRCWASCRRNQRLSVAQVLRRLAGNCFRGPGHANDRASTIVRRPVGSSSQSHDRTSPRGHPGGSRCEARPSKEARGDSSHGHRRNGKRTVMWAVPWRTPAS